MAISVEFLRVPVAIPAGPGWNWQPLIDWGWGYTTTPQAGSYGDEIHYARGQCFGDSSARDYMAYQRWADEVGDRSFTFDSLLPFFEKRLAFTPPDMGLRFEDGNPRYDSQVMSNGSGLLLVTFSHYVQAFGTQTTRGLEAIGIPTIPGSESGSLPGQSHSMFTVNARTMVPDSPETAFLRRGLGYSNYKKRAHAIIVDTHGLTYQLSARKGIILSAAVFGSLQLLLASGVGPAGIPQTLGVMVVADHSGMGQNMQDHIYFGPSCRVNAPTMSTLKDPDFVAEAALAFSKQAARMYTTQSQTSLLGKTSLYHCSPKFFNITLAALAEYPDDWPEVEYISLSVYLALSRSRPSVTPMTDTFLPRLRLPSLPVRFNWTITSFEPLIRGLCNLRSFSATPTLHAFIMFDASISAVGR
ncbi:hypothetical protein BDW68DRAFT_181820 [Aspergillus falconensis]